MVFDRAELWIQAPWRHEPKQSMINRPSVARVFCLSQTASFQVSPHRRPPPHSHLTHSLPQTLTLQTASPTLSPEKRPLLHALPLDAASPPHSHLTDGLPHTLRSASVPPQLNAGAILQARELPLHPGIHSREGPRVQCEEDPVVESESGSQGHQGDVPGVQGEEGPARGGRLGQVQGDHREWGHNVPWGQEVKHLYDVTCKKNM